MGLKNLLLTAFILCTLLSFGQNTILWKVTKPGSKNVSYLLGTYHFFGNSFVDSFPVIHEKLKASDIVITEARLDRQKGLDYYNSRPTSTSLSSVLSQEDINYINTVFKPGIDINKYSPGELLVKLYASYPKHKCRVINAKDEFEMDDYIQHLGQQYQKSLNSLESDSLQLIKIYEATKIYDWKMFKQVVPALLAQYRSETIDESLCLLANQYASFSFDYKFKEKCKGDDMNEVLLKKRNEEWMQKLPDLLEKSNCFVAVGLMHLSRKCGLLEQLKASGYFVEPVSMK
jgi:uncharacterized protein